MTVGCGVTCRSPTYPHNCHAGPGYSAAGAALLIPRIVLVPSEHPPAAVRAGSLDNNGLHLLIIH